MKFSIFIHLVLVFSLSARTYLSQEHIDSTVQEAYYGFVASSPQAGGQYSQGTAIQNAQQVVNKLRELAKDDPNQRYILWRVSELEQQIILEREEMDLKKEYERVTEINRLVAIFNEELFLNRPSFGKLHALHQQVVPISTDHANQFATNINQKNRLVVGEIRKEITNLFNEGKYEGVEEVYRYAIKNKKYLRVDLELYEKWSAKIQAKRNADFLKKNIGKQVSYLNSIVQKNKIAEARRHVVVIDQEIRGAARHLSSKFVQSTHSQLSQINRSITSREDSLVQYNLSLIKSSKKSDKASYYMEQVLRPAGVDPAKVARVDRAILKANPAQKQENKKVNAEIAAISASTTSSSFTMGDLKAEMKIKADSLKRHNAQLAVDVRQHYIDQHKNEFKKINKQHKIDVKNQMKADKIILKADTQNQQGSPQKAIKTLTKKEPFILSSGTPSLYIDVRRDINEALGRSSFGDRQIATMDSRLRELAPERMQETAIKVTTNIYTALHNKNIEAAAGLFYRNESLLNENSYAEALHTLEKTIVKEYSRKYLK